MPKNAKSKYSRRATELEELRDFKSTIEALIKKFPNDQELGGYVRLIIQKDAK
jgi:hypothetical protein